MVERLVSSTLLSIGVVLSNAFVVGCGAEVEAPLPAPNQGPGMAYPADDPGTRAQLENEPTFRTQFVEPTPEQAQKLETRRLRFEEFRRQSPTPNSQPIEDVGGEWKQKNGVESWPSAVNFAGVNQTVGNWNTDICVLRGFRGDFDPTIPNSPSVAVSLNDPATGDIVFSAANTLAEAYAYCTPRSTFTGPNFWPYQDVRQYSFMWDPSPPPNVIRDTAGDSWVVPTPFPANQYATILSGFGYNFTDDASIVSVFRGTASLRSKSPLRLYVQATPIRLRSTAGTVKVTGPNGTGSPASINAWSHSSVGPNNQILQTGKSRSTHVCFYTSMSGNFQHDTWSMLNLNANNQWQVEVRGGTNGSIKVGVLCMPRAQ